MHSIIIKYFSLLILCLALSILSYFVQMESMLTFFLLGKVAAINTAMAALTKTVGVFPKERTIVDRERAKGSYSLGPYLLSKLLAEIPIGAAFPLMFGTVLYPMAHLHPTLYRQVLIVL